MTERNVKARRLGAELERMLEKTKYLENKEKMHLLWNFTMYSRKHTQNSSLSIYTVLLGRLAAFGSLNSHQGVGHGSNRDRSSLNGCQSTGAAEQRASADTHTNKQINGGHVCILERGGRQRASEVWKGESKGGTGNLNGIFHARDS